MSVDLNGAVTVVTGATRGVGRGVAEALGEAGATVYLTGRSQRGGLPTDGLPGTVEEVAAAVGERGGRGIGVRCDHRRDPEVRALFARIAAERGAIDLLVNNVWGGYERYGEDFDAAFWEQPVWRFDAMFEAGVRAHFTASRLAAPLLIGRGAGTIVCTSAGLGGRYMGSAIYEAAKAAVDRLAFGMAQDLRPHGIGAFAVHPGLVLTERVLAPGGGEPEAGEVTTMSPLHVGRAIAALAADPAAIERSGEVLAVAELAERYGLVDELAEASPPHDPGRDTWPGGDPEPGSEP